MKASARSAGDRSGDRVPASPAAEVVVSDRRVARSLQSVPAFISAWVRSPSATCRYWPSQCSMASGGAVIFGHGRAPSALRQPRITAPGRPGNGNRLRTSTKGWHLRTPARHAFVYSKQGTQSGRIAAAASTGVNASRLWASLGTFSTHERLE